MVKKFLQSSPQRRTSLGSKQGSGQRNTAEHAAHGVFDGARDGLLARLLRTGKCGYTVALLASKAAFHQGDHVHLSVTAFEIDTRTTDHDSPVVL